MSPISNTLQACTTAFRTVLLCLETVCEKEAEADIGSHKPPESHSSDTAKDDLFRMKVGTGIGSSMKLTQESHKHTRYHILNSSHEQNKDVIDSVHLYLILSFFLSLQGLG